MRKFLLLALALLLCLSLAACGSDASAPDDPNDREIVY